MTAHSHLTRHHRPPHVWRRWLIWAPTVAVGVLLSLAAPHADLAVVGATVAAFGAAGLIFDHDDT